MTEGQIERFLEGFNETEDCIDVERAFNEINHKGGTWVHAQSRSYYVYLRDEGRYDITEYAPMNRSTYPLPKGFASASFSPPETASDWLRLYKETGLMFYTGPTITAYDLGFKWARKENLLLTL